jgi:hypothetical protein
MPDDPTPEPQDALPKHFVVRLEHHGQVHYVICEAVVSFDESKLFTVGAKALQTMFAGFHQAGIIEVAALPPLGHPAWMLHTAGMEVGDAGGRGRGGG